MKSFVFLVLIALAASSNITESDTEDFLTGFAIPFGLQNATAILIDCANSEGPDVFDNLTQAIVDLENKNITGALTDFLEFLHDIEVFESSCHDGVDPYLDTFQGAIEAYDSDKDTFLFIVAKNLALDAPTVAGDTANLLAELANDNYTQAGEEFGDITQIGLKTWLNSTNSTVTQVNYLL